MSDRRIADLEREVKKLRQALAQRPIKPPKGAASAQLQTVAIIGGNTLTTGQDGIKYSSSTISNVPSAYDPDVDTSFIDGVGRGTLYIDGVAQANRVLIVNDPVGGAINFALLNGDTVVVVAARTLTVGGDPNVTISAYSPAFL